jgi:prepilin peptidase CpaA
MNLTHSPFLTNQAGSTAGLFVLVLVLIVAVYGEVKENRIPNWLTLSGMSLGLLIGYLYGERAFWSHLGGMVIGFGFLFVFYVFGGIGGGDVKLMGAVGSLMGADLIKPTLFYTAAMGAMLAVLIVIWQPTFWSRITSYGRKLAFWRQAAGEPPAQSPPVTVPYGVAIAVGCLMTLLLN